MSDPQEADKAEQPRQIKVMVCTPCHGELKTGMGWSVARAMTFFAQLPYDGEKAVSWEIVKSSNLCEGRTRLVSRAFADGATHILWVDSDMKFPMDAIPRLLNHNVDIVAVNYPTKEAHPRPTAYADSDEYVGPVWTKADATGLVEASSCGFGLMLVTTRVFEAIDLPYFLFAPVPPDNVTHMTEDVYFCRKAAGAGFKIWIDQDLSQNIAHIGDFEYTNFFAAEAETVHQALYRDLPG